MTDDDDSLADALSDYNEAFYGNPIIILKNN